MKSRLTLAIVYGVCAVLLIFIAAGCMDGTTTMEINHVKMLLGGGVFVILSLVELFQMVSIAKEV